MRNTPKAEKACMRISPRWVSLSPIFDTMMNWGTIYTCHGTAMVVTYIRNSVSLPLNLHLVKP